MEAKKIYDPDDSDFEVINNQCDEDKNLPEDLIKKYENDLKCPSGTTSEEGASCIGECIKDKSNPSNIIDPLDENDYDVIKVERTRRLKISYNHNRILNEILYNKMCKNNNSNINNLNNNNINNNKNNNNNIKTEKTIEYIKYNKDLYEQYISKTKNNLRNLDDDSSSSSTVVSRYIDIQPYELIFLNFNFTDLPSSMTYNEHYTIVFLRSDGTEDTLPTYITSTLSSSREYCNYIQFKIFNFNSENIYLQINIQLNNALFSEYSSYFYNSASIDRYLPSRAQQGTSKLFSFLIIQDTFSSVDGTSTSLSLPYNFHLPNQNDLMYSYINNEYYVPDHGYTNKDPYSSTIFDEENIDHLMTPYIPFISNCLGYDKYMYLFNFIENEDTLK